MQNFETEARQPLPATLPSWGVSVLESRHAKDFRMVMSRHDFWQLLYVLNGAGQLHTGSECLRLSEGDAVTVPVDVAHGVEDAPSEPLTLYAVNIHRRLMEPFPAFQPLLAQCRRLRHPSLNARMPDALRRLLYEQALNRPTCDAIMTGLALQILAELAACDENLPSTAQIAPRQLKSQTRLTLYLQELEQHFYRTETMEQVAQRLGLSRRRFAELFRATTGTSWLPYLRRLRIQHARRLLRESSRSVLSVAFECGFEDVSSFYRAFKTETGCRPNEWRRNANDIADR